MNKKPYELCVDNCKYAIDGECTYRNYRYKTVAVDLDGTLLDFDNGWAGHKTFGNLKEGAKEALEHFRTKGFKIMIYTTRNEVDLVKKLLDKYGLAYDWINENPTHPPCGSNKLIADFYIDDRAIHFTNWKDVIKEVENRKTLAEK